MPRSNNQIPEIPPLPASATVEELAAFAGFPALAAECKERGRLLTIRVEGKLVKRCVVWRLHSKLAANVLTEVGQWRVNDRVWLRVYRAPVECCTVEQVATLIRAAMDDGMVLDSKGDGKKRPRPSKKEEKRESGIRRMQGSGGRGKSNKYLMDK